MSRRFCQQCGTPLAKRVQVCIQCDTPVPDSPVLASQPRRVAEWLGIFCVGLSCLVFVVALGLTHVFRDGGWAVGAGSFVAIVLSIGWIGKLEAQAKASAADDPAKR